MHSTSVDELVRQALKDRFLHKCLRRDDAGTVRMIGRTSWEAYRADLGCQIGQPDHDGITEWMGGIFPPKEVAEVVGPGVIVRFLGRLCDEYEREAQEIRDIIRELM